MARTILLVEQSTSMRKIISGMILPNINDARIVEAENVAEAEKQLEKNDCHLVLYVSWDINNSEWLDFFEKTKSDTDRSNIPFVLLTSKEQEEFVQQTEEFGIADNIALPCDAKDMVNMVNRVCDPIKMRKADRYSISNTSVQLAQGDKQWDGLLVNVSFGGMLCDVAYSEGLKWEHPFMVTLFFHDYNNTTVKGLYSILKSIRVSETYSDFTPKQMRCAFHFLSIPDGEKNVLKKIFQEEKKKLED